MDERKKNSVILLLLIGIVLFISFVVLLLTGNIKFGSVPTNSGSDTNETSNTNTSTTEENNNDATETTTNANDTNDNLDLTGSTTVNWEVGANAKKYFTLEDYELTDDVVIKKVKFTNLDDSLTSQFYKDQQAVIDEIHIYSDEYVKFGANHKIKAFVNNDILSVLYLVEQDSAVGTCGTKMAVTNIDLKNKKVVSQSDLLAKVGMSYNKLVDKYYEVEKERWQKYNERVGNTINYDDVTFADFSANKGKYVDIGAAKLPNIIYVYVEDGKVKYDYYTIHTDTLFHQVGKGGCFTWNTVTLGNY